MNRRTYIAAAGTSIASLAGCATLAKRARLDLTLDPSRVRGDGDPAEASRTVDDDSIEYLPATDEVRWVALDSADGPVKHRTEPFERWAKRRCVAVGSTVILPVIEERLNEPLDGIGKGVRGLLFGLVIEVDHTSIRADDGSVKRRPTVDFDELVAIAPPIVESTVALSGRHYTRDVPVVLRHVDARDIEPLGFTADGGGGKNSPG